jgi:hypothetical protein
VIVRISTESQYVFPDDQADRLNDLDNAVVAAVDAEDEDRFHEAFEDLLALVRAEGSVLGVDELEESDVILPPPDTSFVEASTDFTGDGLIPD